MPIRVLHANGCDIPRLQAGGVAQVDLTVGFERIGLRAAGGADFG